LPDEGETLVINFSKMTDSKTKSIKDLNFGTSINRLLQDNTLTPVEKFENFPKYVPRQYLSYYLAKYEVFKKILNVHGSIVECGVFQGGGLLWWAQLSAILEPVNHQRRIFGFDTFEGFASIDKEDIAVQSSDHHLVGGMSTGAYGEILQTIEVFDLNRSISHIPKIEVIKGDAAETIPKFVSENPQLTISLLILDMDVYKPTQAALKHLLPRLCKGGVIWFDELNAPQWPGETMAVIEEVGLGNLKLERFPFDSHSCYAVIQ